MAQHERKTVFIRSGATRFGHKTEYRREVARTEEPRSFMGILWVVALVVLGIGFALLLSTRSVAAEVPFASIVHDANVITATFRTTLGTFVYTQTINSNIVCNVAYTDTVELPKHVPTITIPTATPTQVASPTPTSTPTSTPTTPAPTPTQALPTPQAATPTPQATASCNCGDGNGLEGCDPNESASPSAPWMDGCNKEWEVCRAIYFCARGQKRACDKLGEWGIPH